MNTYLREEYDYLPPIDTERIELEREVRLWPGDDSFDLRDHERAEIIDAWREGW